MFPIDPGLLLIHLSPPLIAQAQLTDKQRADRLFQQGLDQYQSGQLSQALKTWQEAQLLYQQLNDRVGEGQTAGAIGAVHLTLGNYRQSIPYSKLFLSTAPDPQAKAQALSNLAIAFQSIGDYLPAIEYHKQAIAIIQTLKDKTAEGRMLSLLGNAYEMLGDYGTATSHYNQSLTIAQQLKDTAGEASALENLGSIAANLKQYDEALQRYDQALKLARSSNNRTQEISILMNIGSIYISTNQHSKAIGYYQNALTLARNGQDQGREGDALGGLGAIYEKQKQYETAIEHYQRSLVIARENGNIQSQADALNNLGHAFLGAKRLSEAETNLRQVIQLFDDQRSTLSDAEQILLFDTQVSTYNLLQQVLHAANQPEQALEASEQGRARAFAALLARRNQTQAGKSLAGSEIDLASIKQLAKQRNTTLIEYSLIPADDFNFRGNQTAPPEAIFAWIVQPSGKVTLRKLDLNNQSIDQLVANSRESLGVRSRGFDIGTTQTANSTDQFKTLHKLLIEPIQDLLPTNPDDRVVFVPQGILFQVPFVALQDAQDNYLISKHTILTAPSLQVLQFTEQRQRELLDQQGETLIVGNPSMPLISTPKAQTPTRLASLPGSKKEADAIAKLLNVEAFTDDRAKKSVILPKLANARLIHLATHGLLDDFKGAGIPGAIALAPSNPQEPNDGLLTASEISTLKLKADLVVLSACDTAQGTITGDSVIGLSRSLIGAGASSVIVSLWAVPDAPTADLMIEFYKHRMQQRDKARSLRQAMLTVMKSHPHPKNWAAFTLIGSAN
ncbi:TPR repeat-containing protein [Leptolyngbya sp. NIES-3755]|nr:TPR repeat-containing protein [Leptolyngbya sp. NIES-3755]